MIYLSAQHTQPPAYLPLNEQLVPSAPLIAREDSATLALLGVFPHHPNTSPAPLGTEWVEADGEWTERPKGTSEEIAAAIESQAIAERTAYLDGLECTRLQGKLALIQAGLWQQYEDTIKVMLPNMEPAQRVFVEDAQTWRFRDPVLQAFAGSLKMTEEQTVGLFELARTL